MFRINLIYVVLSLLCILNAFQVKGETTKGTINVYNKPGGTVVFKLFDNVRIECGELKNKWQSIVIYLPSTSDYFEGKKSIKRGQALIDSAGRKIGYVVSADSIDFMPLGSKEAKVYQMRLAGYITQTDVEPATVPENDLESLIASNKAKLDYSVFKKFISRFGLRNFKDDIDEKYPPNISYVLYYDTYVSADAVFRIQLVFRNNKLVAVFHSRNFDSAGFSDIKMQVTHLLWVKNHNVKEMKAYARAYHKIYEVCDCKAD